MNGCSGIEPLLAAYLLVFRDTLYLSSSKVWIVSCSFLQIESDSSKYFKKLKGEKVTFYTV